MSADFSVTRLRSGYGPALIFVNGFLNGTEQDFSEWLTPIELRFPHNPCYGVRWNSGSLLEIGAFMTQFGTLTGAALTRVVAAQAVRVLAPSVAGVGLASCLCGLIGNPWHKAYRGAKGAGKHLAQWLQQAGEAEYILMGHSLGAKVVFHALNTLAREPEPSGRVRDVYLLGGAVSNAASHWEHIPPLLSGTMYNVFSRNDDVLRVLYRAAQVGTSTPIGYAGLDLPSWPQLVNLDATPWVEGHSAYKDGLRVALGGLPEGTCTQVQTLTTTEMQEIAMPEDKAPDTIGYEKDFTEEGFWGKVKEYAKTVGCEGIRNALRLFYALENEQMPMKVKAVIYGALGYFISPLDIIPDMIPVMGFTDDIGILAAAIVFAAQYIDANAKARADEKLEQWFGKGAC